jgi:hypothetical protein
MKTRWMKPSLAAAMILTAYFAFANPVGASAPKSDASLGAVNPVSLGLQEKADWLCRQLQGRPEFDYPSVFAEGIRQQIPYQYLIGLIVELHDAVGECDRAIPMDGPDNHSRAFEFKTRTSSILELEIAVETSSPFLISGFFVKNVSLGSVRLDSWQDLASVLQKLEGKASFTMKFPGELRSYQGSARQPLGSGFKLYVLGALAQAVRSKEITWEEARPITAAWKSLPSGVMHTWPDGQAVSILEYATKMISISDNTATDHLIQILGREAVERILPTMGNDFLSDNRPFLTTGEFFKLKWALPQAETKAYIEASPETRRQLLEEVSKVGIGAVGSNGVSFDRPAFIEDIEWFGSTDSLCAAMERLQEFEDENVLSALSQNTPFVNREAWAYAGFKGGSEPGVFTMTYLLQSKDGRWGCLSMAWHDASKPLNQWIFFDVLKKAMALLERH